MISHILRHENELVCIIIEGIIEGKRDLGHTRISFVEQIISVVGLSSDIELKRLDGNK